MPTIVLEGVDPTTFNVVASILVEILLLSTGYVLSEFFRWRLSVWLINGHKVPAKALGRLPGDALEAIKVARAMNLARPAVVVLLLFLSDYCTAIAFAGLGFVLTDQRGPGLPVLTLQQRNDAFPYEALGDPLHDRTLNQLEVFLEQQQKDTTTIAAATTSLESREEITALARQTTTVASFLAAADAVARGESTFLQTSPVVEEDPALIIMGQDPSQAAPWITSTGNNNENENTTVQTRAGSVTVLFIPAEQDNNNNKKEDSPLFLTAINTTIPLTCQTPAMLEFQQTHGVDADFVQQSSVPNCNMGGVRDSGIYNGNSNGNDNDHSGQQQVQVTGLFAAGPSSVALYFQGQPNVLQRQDIPFWPNGYPLARDRVDFRKGRQVFGFGGIVYKPGNPDWGYDPNTTSAGETYDDDDIVDGTRIPFGVTAVAAGRIVTSTLVNEFQQREYTLVSKTEDGQCPPHPSNNNQNENDACIVLTTLTCPIIRDEVDEIVENYGVVGRLLNLCTLEYFQIVWFSNHVVVDEQLVAAVAGVYGRNGNWAISSRQRHTLALHSVPAALLMLASVETMPSIEQVQSTTIDGIFIGFMSLPVALCVVVGMLYLFHQSSILDIPDNGWKMMALAMNFAAGGTTTSALTNGASAPILESENVKYTQLCYAPAASPGAIDQEQSTTSAISLTHNDNTRSLQIFVGSEPSSDNVNGNGDNNDNNSSDLIVDDSCRRNPEERAPDAGPRTLPKLSREAWTVVVCMFFSSLMVVIGATLIASKSTKDESSATRRTTTSDASRDTTGTNSSASFEALHPNQDKASFPKCFETKFELGTALTRILDGTPASQASVADIYGNISDFCIDHINDLSFLFAFRNNLDELDLDFTSWNTSSVEDFSFMFAGWGSTGKIRFRGNLSEWDVSRGIKFRNMFQYSDFNEDISKWNVGSGVYFSSMFHYSEFNSDVSMWDVSKGRWFDRMFSFSYAFDQNVSAWDVSNAEYLSEMFDRTAFNHDLSGWDVSSVKSFAGMFRAVKEFNQDLSSWKTSQGIDFFQMFYLTRFLGDSIGVSGWDVSSARNMGGMFDSSNFYGDLSGWNVSSPLNIDNMFTSARLYHHDLCPWLNKLSQDLSRSFEVFYLTSCPFYEASSVAMCGSCLPSQAPTPFPTATPTTAAPTFETFLFLVNYQEPKTPNWDNTFSLVEVNNKYPPIVYSGGIGPGWYPEDVRAGNYKFVVQDTNGDGFDAGGYLEIYVQNVKGELPELVWRLEGDFGFQAEVDFNIPVTSLAPTISVVPTQSPTDTRRLPTTPPTESLAPTSTSSFTLKITYNELIYPQDNTFRVVDTAGIQAPVEFGPQAGPAEHIVTIAKRGRYRFEIDDSFGDGFNSLNGFVKLELDGQEFWRIDGDFGSTAEISFDVTERYGSLLFTPEPTVTPGPSTQPSMAPSTTPTVSMQPTVTSSPSLPTTTFFEVTIFFEEILWPGDNRFYIENKDGVHPPVVFGFQTSSSENTVSLRQGKYRFVLQDSYGDGFGSSAGELRLSVDGRAVWRVIDFSTSAEFDFELPYPCTNNHEDELACPYWASTGSCVSNPLYMELTCPLACNLCSPT